MTRKDYELLARVIRHLDLTHMQRGYVADQFADALLRTNPRFNRERFFDAATGTR